MSLFPYPNQRYSSQIGLALYGMDEILAENMLLIDGAFASGGTVNVNGSLVINPNFNGTTPAAPGGDTNVTFQVDINGNVSAYVPTPAPGGVTSLTGDSVVYNNASSTGAVTLSLISQVANTFLGGPASGPNATPTFRAIVSADIPSTIVLANGITATTQPIVDSSTKIATDAFVQNVVDLSMATTPLSITGGTYSFASLGVNALVNYTAVNGVITAIVLWIPFVGTGYAIGDIITPQAGNYDAMIVVTSISGAGAPTSGTILYGGTGYTSGTGNAASAAASVPFTYLLSGVLTSNATFIMTPGTYLTQSNQWIFCNNTTGAFTVTVGVAGPGTDAASGGRTVVIPQGTNNSRSVLLQTDGELNTDLCGIVNGADLTVGALQNGMTATTQTAGDNTTKIATDAFVQTAIGGSGAVLWSNLGNAAANLTLANAGHTSTFNQTSAVAWTWANTTPAVASGAATLVTSGTAVVGATSSGTVTLNTVASPAATLIVIVLSGYSSAATISDGLNTWNYLTTYGSGSGKTRIAYAYSSLASGPLATSSSHVFTVGGEYGWGTVYVFSGTLTTSAVLDTSNGNGTPTASPILAGSISPASTDIVVTGFEYASGGVAVTGATVTDAQTYVVNVQSLNTGGGTTGATAYLLNATGVSLDPEWTITAGGSGSALNTAVVAAFKVTYISSSSPILQLAGQVYDAAGPSSIADVWTIQDVIANAKDGVSTLTFTHTGSTGQATIGLASAMELSWNADTGISRLGAASLAIGNGTAGDVSGTLSAAKVLAGNGTAALPSYSFINATGLGFYYEAGSGFLAFTLGGTEYIRFSTNLQLGSAGGFCWNSAVSGFSGNNDTSVSRMNAGVVGVGTGLGGNSSGTLLATVYGFGATSTSTSADTGISRLAGASLAIGNGTAGDVTGALSLATVNVRNGSTITASIAGATSIPQMAFGATGVFGWTASSDATAAFDTEVGRKGVNSLQIFNGTTPGFLTVGGIAVGGTSLASATHADQIRMYTGTSFEAFLDFAGLEFGMSKAWFISWFPNTTITGTEDTSISRIAAGIVGLGTGTQGNSGGTALASVYGWGSTTSATSADSGISRLGPASLAIGNGTAGDFSGTLKCATVNATSAYQANGTPGVTQTAIAVGTLATIEGIVTTFTGVSDERLKNHAPYTGGLEEILGITPIRFTYNELGQKFGGWDKEHVYVGFSAQNVQKSIPEAIQGTEGEEEYLSFDDRPVIAAAVNAIKELAAENKELRKRLDALEAR